MPKEKLQANKGYQMDKDIPLGMRVAGNSKFMMDPVGEEDGDINNDGKKNATDKYLQNRRNKIAQSMSLDPGRGPGGYLTPKAVMSMTAMQQTHDTKGGRPGVPSQPVDHRGNPIHKNDPMFSYKLSKKKQFDVLSRLSADAKGGDIRNMTNKPGTNEMWHPQEISRTVKGSTHTDFNFTNTFDQAFKSAREIHGPGGTFSWRGKKYTTKVKGE